MPLNVPLKVKVSQSKLYSKAEVCKTFIGHVAKVNQLCARLDAYRLADFVDGRYLAPADLLAPEPQEPALFSRSRDLFGHD